ncbi:hypothetical protein J6590_014561 [Homalodisca vitripennis]|nr:hypothetical protein J6590_014561 [Homalodisca vitripennis]
MNSNISCSCVRSLQETLTLLVHECATIYSAAVAFEWHTTSPLSDEYITHQSPSELSASTALSASFYVASAGSQGVKKTWMGWVVYRGVRGRGLRGEVLLFIDSVMTEVPPGWQRALFIDQLTKRLERIVGGGNNGAICGLISDPRRGAAFLGKVSIVQMRSAVHKDGCAPLHPPSLSRTLLWTDNVGRVELIQESSRME